MRSRPPTAPGVVTLDAAALATVTGGRLTHGPAQIDPALIQNIGQLAQAVTGVGQTLAAAKQQSTQDFLQTFMQLAQSRQQQQQQLAQPQPLQSQGQQY